MLNKMLENPNAIVSSMISLISVLIAYHGVRTGYRIANFQIRFQRKSDAYDQFLRAFADYVYEPSESTKATLTSAMYTAALFAPSHIIRELNALVSVTFRGTWRAPGGPAALDEIVDRVVHTLHDDIQHEHLPILVKNFMNKISEIKNRK